jgi:hypothetical protein
MTLADFASFGTALSGAAVTASLIYLAIQTNQSTRHTRALIHQGSAARTTAIRIGLMDSDRAAAWIEGNGAEPSQAAVRQLQFNLECATALDALEDHWLQRQARLVSVEQHARAREGFRRLLALPGLRAYWNDRRPTEERAAPSFAAFVDSLCDGEVTAYEARRV